MTQF